jgi:hypothetical protein
MAMAAGQSAAGEPTRRLGETLLRLAPPDAAVVVTVEGLRDRAHAFAASRLAAELWKLPAVRAWLDSEKYRQFQRSRAHIEKLLGASLTDLRDELLGDAALLALWLPPGEHRDPSQAKGLLLFQARSHALLHRVIQVLNNIQRENGELAQVVDRQWAGVTYHGREFAPAAGRPTEWYIAYPDGTFAFSNSETLIRSVIDRNGRPVATHEGRPAGAGELGSMRDAGLGELSKVKSVERLLPEPAFVRLFVNPRQIERLLPASPPPPSKPSDARVMDLLKRYLGAVDYAGAVLVWNERTIAVHTAETLDPSRLDPCLCHWAGDARRVDAALRHVPSTAWALAAGHCDVLALHEILFQIVPDQDHPKLANLETALTGLLLGQDLRTRILPRLGPGVVAYLDSAPDSKSEATDSGHAPARSGPFPLVIVVELERELEVPGAREPASATTGVTVAAALDNALRTALALAAMDEKRAQGRSRITTRVVAGATVTTLDPAIPFAYAVDRAGSRLIMGTTAGAVARYLECSSDPKAGDRFRLLQAAAFPDAKTFFCADLEAITRLSAGDRERLALTLAARQKKPLAEVERDLARALDLAGLFEAAFVTTRLDPKATAVRRSIGLVLRERSAVVSQKR